MMEKHPKQIEKYSGSLKELAEDIGNLHYESLAEFLNHLSTKLDNDSDKDMSAGRIKLSDTLVEAEYYVRHAADQISIAWTISKPFMT